MTKSRIAKCVTICGVILASGFVCPATSQPAKAVWGNTTLANGPIPELPGPPSGSGPIPDALIGGDGGAPAAPPTGKADPTHGNIFDTREALDTKKPAIFTDSGRYPTKNGASQGVIERRTRGPAPKSNVRNDPKDYPWVGSWTSGKPWANGQETKKVDQDVPINGVDRDGHGITSKPSNPNWAQQEPSMPMPTVMKFARVLVIVGVVFACVFLGFAAWSIVLGHEHAGQKVIAIVGGLMLLLAGYTIYKIVMINAFRFGDPLDPDRIQDSMPPTITEAPSRRAPPE